MKRAPRPERVEGFQVVMSRNLLACALILACQLATSSDAAAAPLHLPPGAEQLIVASSPTDEPADYLVTLRAYARTGSSSRWRLSFGPWPAETGYGHLRRHRHEGDGSTPIGVFGFGATIYGNEPDPRGLHLRYRRLRCGDWWDEDPFSPQYNRFVQLRCGVEPAFAPVSEALWRETVAYPYFAVVDFNVDPTIGGAEARGSGIFLHSWVNGPTAGCVGLARARLLELLRWLDPSSHPVIAIGTDREVAGLAGGGAIQPS
jgi:L,D-peptidoglycan transpeptidase YkuD (ErfK/YbiS/YcfS/YnhG family)